MSDVPLWLGEYFMFVLTPAANISVATAFFCSSVASEPYTSVMLFQSKVVSSKLNDMVLMP